MALTPESQRALMAMLKVKQPESIAAPLSPYEAIQMERGLLSTDPVIANLQKVGRGVKSLLEPETPMDYLMSGLGPAKAVGKGVVNLKNIYHGSPQKNLENVNISQSQRSQGFMPHISGTDNPQLAQAFTKGEFGDKPMGKVYVSEGNFKIIDYTTDEGKKLWDSLGKTDLERAINAKKQGFDGRQITHYEDWKQPFYPEVNFKKIKDAKEIQLFRDIKVKPIKKF